MSDDEMTMEDVLVGRLTPLVAERLGLELVDAAPLSVEEFASQMNMTTSNVYTMIKAGSLEVIPESPRKLIPFREFRRLRKGLSKN